MFFIHYDQIGIIQLLRKADLYQMVQCPAPLRNLQQPGARLYPQMAENKPISSKVAPQIRSRTSVQISGMASLSVRKHGNTLNFEFHKSEGAAAYRFICVVISSS
jgi:hypothetical protein